MVYSFFFHPASGEHRVGDGVLGFTFMGRVWFWFLVFLPAALYSVKKRVIQRCLVGFAREDGKVCGALLCSLRPVAKKALPPAPKR